MLIVASPFRVAAAVGRRGSEMIMATPHTPPATLPPALPRPFNRRPAPEGPCPGEETLGLVRSQVEALLAETPAYHQLPRREQQQLHDRLVHVAGYAAELVRDDWAQSEQLGQRPLIRTRRTLTPETETTAPTQARSQARNRARTPARAQARTQSAADTFRPAAANQIGRVTEETLRAIAFPTFVADLIKSTFQAIVNSTIQQMEAFTDMLENVAKTVDEFMVDNISDTQARGWLAQRYPTLLTTRQEGDGPARLEVRPEADEQPLPDFQQELNTPDRVSSLDEEVVDSVLVPAARRRLAQTRLQMLSTMVMMGLQRIVVRHGRIRATMGFHIDTSDRARSEDASLLDTSVAARASAWYMGFSASVAASVTYVRSTKSESDASLNVNADLTGEVDLTFETDYLPLNRVSTAAQIERIRGNTPNPQANTPRTPGASPAPESSSPSASDMLRTHLERRSAPEAPNLPELPSHAERQQLQEQQQQEQEQGQEQGPEQGQQQADEQPQQDAAVADTPDTGDESAGQQDNNADAGSQALYLPPGAA